MDYFSVFTNQRDFYKSHQTKEISFRKENLIKLEKILKSNEERLYQAIYKDFRKSKFDTYANELSIIYAEIKYFFKNIERLSNPQKVKTNLANVPGKSYIYKEPLGCALVIGAWNYPYQLTLAPVVSAIAAGNTCMIKPSELPENTMRLMAEMINNNFPSNYLYVVEGGIPETTEILKYPFDKIFFTGSPKVGKIVYQAASKNLTPVTLELGGKSPAIVTKSADLDVAAKRIVWGKFLNGGQTCIAPDYILVEESIQDEFLKRLKKQLEEANYEDGAEHYVSIINKRNFNRILGLIEQKKIFYGGKTNEATYYIQPTVLLNVGWEDAVMQEEIFGPVLPVLSFNNLQETLGRINKLDKPLASYLFTNIKAEKELFLQNIPFGGGCVNDTIMHIANRNLPFGGVGNSGIGNYHGEFGFNCFSHQKSVIKKAVWGEPNLKYPPYTEKKLNWIKRLM
jgi:aldehyde dehydrogenase (NAD+)